jgi:molybdate transport system substrate-binding protein
MLTENRNHGFLSKLRGKPMIHRLSLFVFIFVFLPGSQALGDEIFWCLASSMAKPGQELADKYNARGAGGTVILITGGSGQLLSKISAAKKGDFYTPAATDYIARAEKLGFVESHRPLVMQTPVFALSARGTTKIKKFSDLAGAGVKIALGNPGTMALGRSYDIIKESLDPELVEAIKRNTVVEAINVSQVMNYLQRGIVDAGISFDTTANAHKLHYLEFPASSGRPETVPLIRLNFSRSGSAAEFEQFLFDNIFIFTRFGFRAAD